MRDKDMLLLDAVRQDDVEEAKALLDSGADINLRIRWPGIRNQRAMSASLLCEALIHESGACAALLLERGIEIKDRLEMECACGSAIAEAAIIERLIDAGCDPRKQYLNGDTYLHSAVRSDVVDALVKSGASVDARNKRDETPLMLAAKEGRLDACSALIDAGADARALNIRQEAALHLVAKQGRFNDRAEWECSGEIAALLLAHGADIDAKDHLGQTALHLAASANNVRCAEILLGAGASFEQVDKRGYTASDLAVKDEVKALFLAHRERLELTAEAVGNHAENTVQSRKRI